MTRLTLFFLLLSSLACGQAKDNISDIVPRGKTVKPLLTNMNYVDDGLRTSIIQYLNAKKLDPSKYYVDSAIYERGDTLYIPLWNIDGFNKLKAIDRQNEKSENKMILTGNPGNCGTIEYNHKSKKIIGFFLWQ